MSKQRNNRQQSKRKQGSNVNRNIKKKKRKINNKKLVLILGIFMILAFGVNKAVVGVSSIAKEIANKKESSVKTSKEISNTSQFDIDEEIETTAVKDKYVVVIDPGHGGKDPGNIGYSTRNNLAEEDVHEKDIVLDVSKKVATILSQQEDVQVRLTRSDDEFIDLGDRAKIANEANADAFVSIHMNAEYGGTSAVGVETYHRPAKEGSTDQALQALNEKSEELAKTVQSTVSSYIEVRDRGVKQDIFQVLQESQVPSALIECGFLTNQKEEQKLLDEQYQDKLAEGIAQGILTFLDENIKE